MSTDPLQKNEIISRWKNKQTVRAIARDLGLGRYVVARVIHLHLRQTEPTESATPPASFGNVPLTRKTKLEPFCGQLQQLLDRYPNLTALRAFEELRKLGFEGSYSTVRTYIKTHRVKPKAKTVRFETAPGAQAHSLGGWSTDLQHSILGLRDALWLQAMGLPSPSTRNQGLGFMMHLISSVER